MKLKLLVKKAYHALSGSLARRFLGNTSWMIFRELYYSVVSLLVGAYTARYLGPENLGIINYAASVIAILLIVSKVGLEFVVIRELKSAKADKGTVLGSALLLRLLASLLTVAAAAVICLFFDNDPVLQQVLMIQAVSLPFCIYDIFNFWFQSRLESKYPSIAGMIAVTVVSVWRIILIINECSVQLFSTAVTLSSVVTFLIVGIVFLKKIDFKLKVEGKTIVGLLRHGYHFFIPALAVVAYTHIDKLMIGSMLEKSDVGIYSAAVTIAALWEVVPNAIISSMNPLIIEGKNSGNADAYKGKLSVLFCSVTAIGLIFLVGYVVFGKLMIHILYGNAYASAYGSLLIIATSTVFAIIGSARACWFAAEGLERYSKYCLFIGLGLNVVFNYLLIPVIGIAGAAIATLVTEFCGNILCPLLFKETRSFVSVLMHSYKGGLAQIMQLKAGDDSYEH